MALVTLQYPSDALMKNTTVYLVIPERIPLRRMRAVYLLHGLSEDGSSWIRRTNAERYALERGLILIMPSAERSMYCDRVLGQNYFTHITEELPAFLQGMFGISRRREQNSILGFSMGGYGAVRAALTYPKRYAAWGSFSGPLDLAPLVSHLDERGRASFPFLLEHAGELDRTPLNPVNLLNKRRQGDLPGYVVCGTQDDLLICSQRFQERAERAGLPIRFYYPEGLRQDWAYCDSQLPAFLDFVLEV